MGTPPTHPRIRAVSEISNQIIHPKHHFTRLGAEPTTEEEGLCDNKVWIGLGNPLYSSGSRIWSPSFREQLPHIVSACGLRHASQGISLPGPVHVRSLCVGILGSRAEGWDSFPPWQPRGRREPENWRHLWSVPEGESGAHRVGLRGREEQGFAFRMCLQTTFLPWGKTWKMVQEVC